MATGSPSGRCNLTTPQLAFESKSTGELMRAYAVFTACQVG